jgi:hypothetical protein
MNCRTTADCMRNLAVKRRACCHCAVPSNIFWLRYSGGVRQRSPYFIITFFHWFRLAKAFVKEVDIRTIRKPQRAFTEELESPENARFSRRQRDLTPIRPHYRAHPTTNRATFFDMQEAIGLLSPHIAFAFTAYAPNAGEYWIQTFFPFSESLTCTSM